MAQKFSFLNSQLTLLQSICFNWCMSIFKKTNPQLILFCISGSPSDLGTLMGFKNRWYSKALIVGNWLSWLSTCFKCKRRFWSLTTNCKPFGFFFGWKKESPPSRVGLLNVQKMASEGEKVYSLYLLPSNKRSSIYTWHSYIPIESCYYPILKKIYTIYIVYGQNQH